MQLRGVTHGGGTSTWCLHRHLEIIGLQLFSVQDCPKPWGLQKVLGTPKSGGTDPCSTVYLRQMGGDAGSVFPTRRLLCQGEPGCVRNGASL